MADYDYDLFVIGAGSGGVRAARIASQHGAKVAIAEEYRYGGTCVIRGCVPKKLFVYASRFKEEFETAGGFGWTVPEPEFDWPSLIANKDKELARLEAAYQTNLEKAGVETIRTRAVLTGPHTVRLEADGREVTAERILIATGGRPNLDESLPGIEHVITSEQAFHLEALPKRIVIAGGGYIAVEFAGIFAGLGVETTLLYRGEKILRGFDEDMRDCVTADYQARGINVVTNDVFLKIEKTDAGLVGHLKSGGRIEADQIMFAIGRSPYTKGLGLEAAGVETGKNGAITVDAKSQTNVPHIYAVGDVTDRVALTPVAIREGHAFADTVFGNAPRTVDYDWIASAVFSTWEIGTVGMTEAEALDAYPDLDVYDARFRPMKTVMSGGETRAYAKLLVDRNSDRVVGCHIFGHDAAEIVQCVAIAMRMGATKAQFDATMALHPSFAEELVTMRTPSRRHGTV
jgi:glutathione reductase (NADPH)